MTLLLDDCTNSSSKTPRSGFAIRHTIGMGDNNYYEAHARGVNLESITSTKFNALILEKLRNNDDEFKTIGIGIGGIDDDYSDDDFVVEEGDDLG